MEIKTNSVENLYWIDSLSYIFALRRAIKNADITHFGNVRV